MKHIYSFRIKGFLFLTLLMTSPFWGATLGHASTFYVAKTGSNNNSCTAAQSESTPKSTIKSGAACLSGGDTLLIKSGTYVEVIGTTGFNAIPGSTSWANATTVAADTGETVIIRGPVGADHVFYFRGNMAAYIILDGLILDGSDILLDIVKIDQFDDGDAAHHIRIINSELRNGPSKAVLAINTTHHIEILNSNIHDNGQTSLLNNGHYSYNLYIQGENNLIENCDVSGAGSFGIHIYNGYTGQSNNNIIRNNRIFGNGVLNVNPSQGGGVVIGTGSGNQIYNNVFYDNRDRAIRMNRAGKILNNTMYSHDAAAIEVAYASGNEIYNNIFWSNGTDGVIAYSVSYIESNNLTVDPQVVDASNFDFRLQSSSPAIDAGLDLSEKISDEFSNKDLDGTPRGSGSGWDIGAYEFLSEVDTDPPAQPKNVNVFLNP